MQIMISCTKGILNDSLETVNQVLERVLPKTFHHRLAYLSGPSFAAEVKILSHMTSFHGNIIHLCSIVHLLRKCSHSIMVNLSAKQA